MVSIILLIVTYSFTTEAFTPASSPRTRNSLHRKTAALLSKNIAMVTAVDATGTGTAGTDVWELDCYSRPVMAKNGKKVWELLICDSSGVFQHVEEIPSNKVNSREVRGRIEKVIDNVAVRPRVIRFFRKSMLNILSIALNDIGGIKVEPSRSTYAMYQWLEDRNKNVYPTMPGFKKSMVKSGGNAMFLDISTPDRLPDMLRADQFAFVSLPLSEITDGGVNPENIGVGQMCPLPKGLPEDSMVQGVLFLTTRGDNLASWFSGTDLAFMRADLKRREMVMEVGLSTRYLMARLNEEQRIEGQAFEAGKTVLKGLHFVAIQNTATDDEVAGFWLLREVDMS